MIDEIHEEQIKYDKAVALLSAPTFTTKPNKIASSHATFGCRDATRANHLNAKQQTGSSCLIIFFVHRSVVIHCVGTMQNTKRVSRAQYR